MFFVAAFFFYAVGYALLPTLPLVLSGRGATPSEVGLIMGSFTLSALVLRAPVGMLLARRDPMPLLRYGQAVLAAGFGFYLLPGLWPVFGGRVLQGVGMALFNTAAYVYLARAGGQARRAEYISLFGLSANIAMAVAPAAGSLVMRSFGEAALFLGGGMVALAGLLLIPRPAAHKPLGGVAQLWEPRAMRPGLVMLGLAAAYGTVMVFVPLAVVAAGLSNGWLFFSTYAAGIVATRLLTRRLLDRGARLHWAAAGSTLMITGLGVLSIAGTWPFFMLSALLFGVGVGTAHPSLMAYILECVPDEFRSGAAAVGTSAFDLGATGGAALAGYVTEHVAIGTAFQASATVFALSWFALASTKRGVQRSEQQP
jgi:MFS family permease